ncbi:MAG: hypothetical protein AAFQ66_12925 [Pseudomonadota bacterium]
MRWLCLLLLMLPSVVNGQSAIVAAGELQIEVSLDDPDLVPYVGELVMVTIRGTYRRHITREALHQPDLDGFNWSQLGPDDWHQERIGGKTVKVFQRRMALYPTRPGTLTIRPFRHDLTLTDAGDDWFEHEITSRPVTLQVQPVPTEADGDWWFPVRFLEISDQWSNAPDQLQPGDGVLRVIRLEAHGATPEMIPPMPELASPSAMIFPHPEKRLVELTPHGPVTYAFWRWTIRPTNDVSAILEPLEVSYFNTQTRQHGMARITPQRVAYRQEKGRNLDPMPRIAQAQLPGWPMALIAGFVFILGTGATLSGRKVTGRTGLTLFDPVKRALRQAARRGEVASARRLAQTMALRDGPNTGQQKALADLDRQIYSPNAKAPDLQKFAKGFLRRG